MPFSSAPETFRKPSETLPPEAKRSTLVEQIGAAFQIENTVGSFLRDVGDPSMQAYDAGFDVMEHLEEHEKPFASAFADANSPQDVNTIRGQIDREREARRVMASGPLPEIVAGLPAVVADPTTFLPGLGAVAKGGKLSAKLATAAGGSAADVAISEAALQATQRERTMEESAYSIVLGGAFGFGIGSGAAALTARKAIKESVGDAMALSDAVTVRSGEPDSAGAMRAEVNAEDTKLESFVGQAALDKMSRYNVAPVSLQMKSSELSTVRRLTDELVTTNLVTQGNVQGVATAPSVELKVKRYDAVKAAAGRFAKDFHRQHKRAGGVLGYGEFLDEVGKTLRRGDEHQLPDVAEAAKRFRSDVFDPLKDEAVKLGMLPEDVSVSEALSYFTRVYDREKIKARRHEFKAIIERAIGISVRKEHDDLSEKAAAGLTNNERVLAAEQDLQKLEAERLDLSDQINARVEANRSDIESKIATKSKEMASAEADIARLEDQIAAKIAADPDAKIAGLTKRLEARQKVVDARKAEIDKLTKRLDEPGPGVEKLRAQLEGRLRAISRANETIRNKGGGPDDGLNAADSDRFGQISRMLDGGDFSSEADQVIDKILGNSAARTDFFPTPLERGPLKERTLHIPDEIIEEFLVDNALDVSMRYISTMAADVEMTRAFGRADMEDQLAEIQSEANDLIAKAGTEADRIRIQDEATKQTQNLKAMADLIRNRYGNWGEHTGMKRVGRAVRQLNFVRLLGSVAISSIPDVGRIVMEEGFLRAVGGLVADMATGFKGIRMAMREAQLAGTALDMVLATRTRNLADLGDRYIAESRFERGLNRMSDSFGLINMLSPWTDGMKAWSSAMASSRILRTVEKMAEGKKLTRSERLKLAAAGIDEGLARAIHKEAGSWERHTGGLILANTEAWTNRNAVEAFRNALLSDVDKTVITPGVADKPLWMHGEVGKFVGQFKSFAMASTTKALASGLQTRDLAVLNGALVMIGLGAMSTALRDLTRHGDVKDREPRAWVAEGIDRSGLMAIAMELDLLAEVATGHSALGALGGSERQRAQSRDKFGQLLGPGVGAFEDTFTAIRSALDGEMTQRDVGRIIKMAPGQNLWYLRWLTEQLKEASGLPEK